MAKFDSKNTSQDEMIRMITTDLEIILLKDNPKFDIRKFEDAIYGEKQNEKKRS